MAPDPPLFERYTRGRGRVHLTGLQALVRLALDQLRRDELAGRKIGALFSGYPGSPLAGFDQLLRHLAPLLERANVRLAPGLNEELAASTVAGTQLLEVFPHASWDGAIGSSCRRTCCASSRSSCSAAWRRCAASRRRTG